MLIGVDFDNTIVYYDELFHRLALERGLIPRDLSPGKDAVRDHLRAAGREHDWTLLQGYVYGARIDEAAPFPGVVDFFRRCRELAVEVCIVSHKTRRPFLGPAYDLHRAARDWLARQGFHEPPVGIPPDAVYFETTKQGKLARIAQAPCTHFIDDLPELLAEPAFPVDAQRILFDPNDQHLRCGHTRMTAWSEIEDALLGHVGATP